MDNLETSSSRILDNNKKRKTGFIIAIVVGVIVAVILAVGIFVVSQFRPIDASSEEIVTVEIPSGSTNSDIGTILEDAGVIKNANAFMFNATSEGAMYMAGAYDLSPSMTLDEISTILEDGSNASAKVKIVIPEGLTLYQISEIIAEAVGSTADEVFAQINDDAFVQEMMAMFPELLTDEILDPEIKYPLEGYLFPATYTFYEENPTVDEIVIEMLEATEAVVSEYIDDLPEGVTVHELLTLASIVEKETNNNTDREAVAGVFYNRLEIGMPLQSDITVLYAQGIEHAETVYYKDLEYEDPYNTYLNYGLPPGPICSPGEASIQAALNPAEHDYLYFITDPEGNEYLAETYDEHLENADKYME